MDLGAFSISLSVKDVKASRQFYEKLGFEAFGGKEEDNWLMLKNGNAVIGLFQGMFDKNMLTFNPGWDAVGNDLPEFTDVRQLQQMIKERGVELDGEVDPTVEAGPGFFTLVDPDGNPILVDQHR
ncbi:MAG: VOC family protein [Anaerolineales bacterium]|nr:VOC family protein [Anaerolineales bacterium]MCW5855644.1 VOC family protein [Anaerolineales bacterium]